MGCEHDWVPVAGEAGRYACGGCGAPGERRGREVRASLRPPRPPRLGWLDDHAAAELRAHRLARREEPPRMFPLPEWMRPGRGR